MLTFIDRGFAGRFGYMAENIVSLSRTPGLGIAEASMAPYEKLKENKVPFGFKFKNQLMFFKTNSVPKIRTSNYGSAYEVAVWLVKPQDVKKATPEIFNYNPPIKNLRLYPDTAFEKGKVAKKYGKLDVAEYHNTCSSNVFLYSIGSKKTGHPCEKYEKMLQPIIEHHSNPGSLIVDPFAGGFNSGLVAKKLGRKYVGFELEQEWFDKAIELLKE